MTKARSVRAPPPADNINGNMSPLPGLTSSDQQVMTDIKTRTGRSSLAVYGFEHVVSQVYSKILVQRTLCVRA
jgi:hypothetical protein